MNSNKNKQSKKRKIYKNSEWSADEDVDVGTESPADIEIRMDNYGYISIKDYGKISEMECTDVFPNDYIKREKRISYAGGVPADESQPVLVPVANKAFNSDVLKHDVDKKLIEINNDFALIKEHTSIPNRLLEGELSRFLEKLNQAWRLINQIAAVKA